MKTKNLNIPPTCQTCEHWEQRFPQNPQLGACLAIGVLKISDDAALTISHDLPRRNPTTDFPATRTQADFGCRFHSDYLFVD